MAMSKITMRVRKTTQLPPPLTIPGDCAEARLGPNTLHNGLDLENAFSFTTEAFPYESDFVNFNILSPSSSISIFPELAVNRNGYPDLYPDLNDPEAVHDGLNESWMRNAQEINPADTESDLNTNSSLFYEDDENDEIDVVTLEESIVQFDNGKFDESMSHYVVKQEQSCADDAGLDSNFEVPSPESGIQEVCGVDNCLNYNNGLTNLEEDHSLYKGPAVPPVSNLETGTRKRKISNTYVESLSDEEDRNYDENDDDDNDDDDDEEYKCKSTYKKKRKITRKPYTRKKRSSSNSYDSDAAEEICTDTGTYMSKRKREQNKRAATKYRNKKKLEEVENINRLQELMDKNKELRNAVRSREHEVKVMRQLLLEVMKKK